MSPAAVVIWSALATVLVVLIVAWVQLLRSCLLGHDYEREGATLVKRCRRCGRRAPFP